MTFEHIYLLFPFIMAIHNLDEFARHSDFVGAHSALLPKRFRPRRVVRNAQTLLTLFVALLAGLAYVYKADDLVAITKVSVFALALNAVGHCILSVRRRIMVPGTLSAAVLVLPYSIVAIATMHMNLTESYWSLLSFAALGAITIPVAVMVFLWMGYVGAWLQDQLWPGT